MLALTGWGQEDDRRRSAEAGFDGHLIKPVDLEQLLKWMAAGRDGSEALA
jgi:CheY-like chemotaxis protein